MNQGFVTNPNARVVISEIDDEESGVHRAGPVARLLSTGATAHLPPRPLDAVTTDVHAYLVHGQRPALESETRAIGDLPPTLGMLRAARGGEQPPPCACAGGDDSAA